MTAGKRTLAGPLSLQSYLAVIIALNSKTLGIVQKQRTCKFHEAGPCVFPAFAANKSQGSGLSRYAQCRQCTFSIPVLNSCLPQPSKTFLLYGGGGAQTSHTTPTHLQICHSHASDCRGTGFSKRLYPILFFGFTNLYDNFAVYDLVIPIKLVTRLYF